MNPVNTSFFWELQNFESDLGSTKSNLESAGCNWGVTGVAQMLYLCEVKCLIGLQQWALVFGFGNGLRGSIAGMQLRHLLGWKIKDLQPIYIYIYIYGDRERGRETMLFDFFLT